METEDKFLESFAERYRQCNFVRNVRKKDQYNLVGLEIEKGGPPYLLIEILTFDYNKLKLEDDNVQRKTL